VLLEIQEAHKLLNAFNLWKSCFLTQVSHYTTKVRLIL